MTKTRTHQLIELKLSRPLADYVRERRQCGSSWHAISVEIAAETGVAVTPESVRIWMSGEDGMERRKAVAS